MKTVAVNEAAFEQYIERALVGSTREEREAQCLTDIDKQQPDDFHFYWGKPQDMDKKLAIDLRRLWAFLRASQQEALDNYRGVSDMQVSVPQRIAHEVETRGIIDVLRRGVDVDNIHLSLFYPRPSAADGETVHRHYSLNQWSLTRQQTFSLTRPGLEIDLVLYINGMPIFTFELKNPWTQQTARVDGIKQYKSEERSPREPLLRFGRCLAHFAVDKDDAFFCTHLDGQKSYFMPFNQGLPDGEGAGNPVNTDGFATSYLWERILQKDTLADIISNFALFDYGETKTQTRVPHIMRNAKTLIFPRFHQLDVVQRLLADVSTNGVGKTYLIQHSAGSGKSNSLTWLAYKLIALCPTTMEAKRAKGLTEPLFSSVIIVTDRRILDKQITDNLKAYGQSPSVFAHADTSRDLRLSIERGKRIISTTIQKFPFICDAIRDVSDRNFAIVIDEAHSSQSGIAADKLNATMQKGEGEEKEMSTDELLMKMMTDRKMSTNCSYFAFTATPKKETLERFGTKDAEGHFHPFHLYSMKQAIEEGFILDVLTNYTTYKSYYELVKSIKYDPTYDNKKAQKLLKMKVERDSKPIHAKAEQMLNHFDTNIYRTHKLCGKAKAMVVTKDIECAINYYMALNEVKREKQLPYNILIAFSGEKEVNGTSYTEEFLNGFAESKTAEEFDKDENRLIVVANKYLTGFDQPKLTAMYIDKPLAGVLAVQALSRLNRSAPSLGKRSEDLFVLDFYNTTDEIKEAFDPYYKSTSLSGPTDPNILHELRSTLLSVGVFEQTDIDEFIELYIKGNESTSWAPIIDQAAMRFNKEIEWPDNGKADFKMKCKQFVKVYGKIATIIPYCFVEWEKLFWFLRFLIPQLHIDGVEESDLYDLLSNVDLNTYGLKRQALNASIALAEDAAPLDPNKAAMAGAKPNEEEDELLSVIVEIFNTMHFTGWDASPEEQRDKILSIAKAVTDNDLFKNYVVGNPDPEAAADYTNRAIDKVVREKQKGDMSLYKQYLTDGDFKMQLRSALTRLVNVMMSNPDHLELKE